MRKFTKKQFVFRIGLQVFLFFTFSFYGNFLWANNFSELRTEKEFSKWIVTSFFNNDNDGDGIDDINDLDDDNDGIPDAVEDAQCIIFIDDFGFGAYPGAPLSGTAMTDFIYNDDPAGSVWPAGLQDGEYTIAPTIFDANGDWPNIFDHTSEDGTGYAYVVNASVEPSEFYSNVVNVDANTCLLYTSPSPRDQRGSRMPSSA